MTMVVELAAKTENFPVMEAMLKRAAFKKIVLAEQTLSIVVAAVRVATYARFVRTINLLIQVQNGGEFVRLVENKEHALTH